MSAARLARASGDVLTELENAGFAIVADAFDADTLAHLREAADCELANATGGTRHADIDRPAAIASHALVAATALSATGGDHA